MSFIEARLDDGLVILDTLGGPEALVDSEDLENGRVARNMASDVCFGRWDVGSRRLNNADLSVIQKMFRAARGPAYGFRWKDWTDYRVGYGEGGMTVVSGLVFQLEKLYTVGGVTERRPIYKPVNNGELVVLQNAVDVTGSSAIDYTTGRVTLAAYTPGDTLAWTGEFDVPVLFATKSLQIQFLGLREADGEAIYELAAVPIREYVPI